MQSKQRKQGGSKPVKKTSRNENKRQPMARKRSSRPKQSVNTATVRAPLNTAMIRDLAYGLRFSAAPPHDRYPSGGLRISALLPAGTYVDAPEANEYTGGIMYADTGSTGFTSACLVTPCATAEAYTARLFDSDGPIPTFAQYFSQYIFRELDLVWTSKVPPSSSDQGTGNFSIQVAYEADPLACWSNAFTDQVYQTTSTSCTRFPAWTPEVTIPVIKRTVPARDDQLFYCTSSGDSFSMTGGEASARQIWQGGFYMSSDTKLAASLPDAPVVLSRIMTRFIIDLYGFRNDNGPALPMDGKSLSVPRSLTLQSAQKEKAKGEKEKLERKSSEPQDDFVEVPKAVATPSRVLSLKGTKA